MTGRRRRRWMPLTLAGLLSLSACSLGPSRQPDLVTDVGAVSTSTSSAARSSVMPTGPGGPGRTSTPVDWSSCPSSYLRSDPTSGRTFALDCGQVSVPIAYSGSRAGHIAVAVTRARSKNVPENAPVLLTVLDPPGTGGTHQVAVTAGSLPIPITDHFAIVVLDPRGTGDSANVDCISRSTADDLLAPSADPTTANGAQLISTLTRTLTFDCGDEAGPDLSSFASIPLTDDLDTVRAALGVSQITYLGRGFGATLGALYVDRYPGRVAAMVLDGPEDPLQPADKRALAVAAAAEKSFASFVGACPSFAGGCPLGADPSARITQLMDDLGDTGTGASRGQLVTGGSVLLTLLLLLGDPERWPALAKALAVAVAADGSDLGDLLLEQVGGDDREAVLAGRIIFGCNDITTRLSGAGLNAAMVSARKTAPRFGAFVLGLVGLCGGWPVPDQAMGAVTGAGAAPLLVLGAVADPLAPIAAVQSLAGQLRSAELVRWQSGQHGSYPADSCITTVVDAYLLRHTLPAPDTLCPP